MYVQTQNRNCKDGKVTTCHLLRKSYRENGKVKKQTIANISYLSDTEIANLKIALSGQIPAENLLSSQANIKNVQGTSVGAILALKDLSDKLGISKALGNSNEAKLALWQVLARIIEQGSRLASTRLAKAHAADKLLNIAPFNEDDLYQNLKWICDNQKLIETQLYKFRKKKKDKNEKEEIFLYDVTSSYFEGIKNELAFFGYNRDGKKGKRQIVIGLLCDKEGVPLSVEVFNGNTKDNLTVSSQIKKISERFGGSDVVFVGDRGMIKSQQVIDLLDEKMHYITAITKPQIKKMLENKIIQISMFDIELSEIIDDEVRYILRKNPIRAKEIAESRASKYQSIIAKLENQNKYLTEHPRASVAKAKRAVTAYAKKLKTGNWITIRKMKGERCLTLKKDETKISEIAKLDGCYILKTDLTKENMNKEIVHSRYKDLAAVEHAFRTFKQDFLELRPIFVRCEASTRGHVFVVMLSYILIKDLRELWKNIELTVEEGIKILNQLCSLDVYVKGIFTHSEIPEPNEQVKKLLTAAKIKMAKNITRLKSEVDTRKKLVSER